MHRIYSIDFVRGLVMIIMALDHTRQLLHVSSVAQDPTDLATTTPALFFTRWITHLCAPTFVFLSGTSAYLSMRKQSDRRASRRFLITRGLWLIVLEFTLITLAIWGDWQFRTLLFQVIAAIGAGFVILGLLLRIPPRWLGALGLLIVFGHDALPAQPFGEGSAAQLIWSIFFARGAFSIGGHSTLFVLYPIVPWLGIMLTGFAAGTLFDRPAVERRRLLAGLGLGTLAVFVLLRTFNLYGDPAPWAPQSTGLFSFLSFVNTTKYPPSLLFTLMTLGIMFLLLAAVEGLRGPAIRVVSVYGQVPLFYYFVHWVVIHLAMFVVVLLQGYRWAQLPFGTFQFGRPEGAGIGLGGTYLVWLSVVVLLYPVCRWYARYKAERREVMWLRYV
jgi:uncharacterized membrane protein